MRFSAVALALAGMASAASQSICDKYTIALLKDNTPANQAMLVTLLVKTAAIGNYTGPGTKNPSLPGSKVMVPGLLAQGKVGGVTVDLAKYFNGQVASTNVGGKAEAINWLDNGSDLISSPLTAGTPGSHGAVLFDHLVSYFGVLLGCSGYGKSGYPAYTGSNDMGAVHQYMDLSEAEFTWFVMNVGLSAQSFGAAQSDITAAAMALNSTFGMRCAAPAMVVPGTPKLPQAICQDSTCPMASPAMCNAYAAVSQAKTVSSIQTAPATIMPATFTPTASGSAAASASASTSSAAAGPMITAAGHVLAAGALVAALL